MQELYVLLVKFYLRAPGSASLHNVLTRVAANLHLPLSVIPELDRRWGDLVESVRPARER